MTANTTPRGRKAAQIGGTLAVIALAGAVFIGGLALITAGSDASSTQAAPQTTVGTMAVQAQDHYRVTRRFTGQIEAATRADLAFELGGRITEITVNEGDIVAKGAVLARLDTSALEPERDALLAEMAALAADAELAQVTLSRNDTLTARGVQSVATQDQARLTLARVTASMAAAQARLAGVDLRIEKSVLRAPFAATVGARMADLGQTAAIGQPVMVLFDTAPARARIGLPPDLAAGLTIGDLVTVALDGAQYQAVLRHIRPDLDPATRSRAVLLDLPADLPVVLGQTITLMLDQQIDQPGFWAPLTALIEGARGSWAVMAIIRDDADATHVQPAAVEVIHTDGAQVYLRSTLADGALIVARAPARVVAGQSVLTVPE
jgi:membrane fusion protein, multidrug efflux system